MTETDENRPESPLECEEVSGSWQFLHRVGQMSLVEQAISSTAESYQKVKSASPSMLKPAIESVETTTIKMLERIITTIQALPLPLKYADEIACNGLDTLESLTAYKYWILKRLRAYLSKDNSFTTDEEYFGKLIKFASETKKMAAGDTRKSLEAFLETQIGLFERIEGAVESYYRIHNGKRALAITTLRLHGDDSDLSRDLANEVFRLRLTFEDAMEERNLLDGRPNPLEPMWRYLQALVEGLTAEEITVRRFREKIYFIKIVLQSTVDQMKLAAADPANFSLEEAKNTMIDQLTGLALAWLPDFALNGFSRITGYRLPDRTSHFIMPKSGDEEPEGNMAENGGPGEASTSAISGKTASSVTINVQCETPREDRQQVTVSETRATCAESDGFLDVSEDKGVETGDSSDQNSVSGQEHCSEVETNNGEGRRKTSRPSRRRRRKSEN